MSNWGRQQGFTLIELLVTMVVVAIIASLAAPSFTSTLASQRLDSTARDLVSQLSVARSQAILKRHSTVVCTSVRPNGRALTENNCANQLIRSMAGASWGSMSAAEKSAGRAQVIDQGRVFLADVGDHTLKSGSDFRVFFNAQGSASTAATLEICSGSSTSKIIEVSIMGSASQSKGTCS